MADPLLAWLDEQIAALIARRAERARELGLSASAADPAPAPPAPRDYYITPKEAMAMAKCSKSTLYRWLAAHKLSVEVNGRHRIVFSDFQNFLTGNSGNMGRDMGLPDEHDP